MYIVCLCVCVSVSVCVCLSVCVSVFVSVFVCVSILHLMSKCTIILLGSSDTPVTSQISSGSSTQGSTGGELESK